MILSTGTVGNQVLSGLNDIHTTIDKREVTLKANCRVLYMSFSSHADRNGIIQYIRHIQPHNVVLVHGELDKMIELRNYVNDVLQVNCIVPYNFQQHIIKSQQYIAGRIDTKLLYNNNNNNSKQQQTTKRELEHSDNISNDNVDSSNKHSKTEHTSDDKYDSCCGTNNIIDAIIQIYPDGSIFVKEQ